MKSLFLVTIVILFSFLSVSCNLLEEFGDATSDEALFFDARRSLASGDYTAAIDKIDEISTTYQARREVQFVLAKAYAGRCGMDFLSLVEALEVPTDNILVIFMNAMAGADITAYEDCVAAEDVIKTMEPLAADRTVDENLFMAFLGFSKIGAVLHPRADTDANGVPDTAPAFNACTNPASDVVGRLTDELVTEVVTGLALAIEGITESGSTIATGESDDLTGACTTLAALNPNYNFCSATDASSVTADHITGMRLLIMDADAIGLSYCSIGALDCCL